MREKLNIKYIYVSCYTNRKQDRCTIFDIAIVTDDMKYAEYEICTRRTEMTPLVQSQYQSLLADWQLSPDSRIYFHENVGPKEPARLVFKTVAQQMRIKQLTIGTDKMIRRLCHIHPNFINRRNSETGMYVKEKTGKKYFLQAVWRKVVKTGLCPWISKAYDEYLMSKRSREKKYRKQLLRLGMYYICESRTKCGYDVKSNSGRAVDKNSLGSSVVKDACSDNRPMQIDEDEVGFGIFS